MDFVVDQRLRRNRSKWATSAIFFIAGLCTWFAKSAIAEKGVEKETSLRACLGLSVTSVRWAQRPHSGGAVAPASLALPYPRPRLGGYLPLVVVTTSDQRKDPGDLDFCHQVQTGYLGNPLETPLDHAFAFGVFDTGADFDLFAGDSALALGLHGTRLTPYEVPIGGVGGAMAKISHPVGVFAAGLVAIGEDGSLSMDGLVGHSNVSTLAAPPIFCNEAELLTGVIGMPFVSFFNSIIRVDTLRSTTIAGVTRTSPDVLIQQQSEPLPTFSRKLLLEFGGPVEPVLTACYYPNFDPFDPSFGVPIFPTELSQGPLEVPSGGSLLTTMFARMGEPGPTNPESSMRMLLDTGAQVSLITPAAIVRLSLPNTPDFTVTLCGIGGSQDVPGYYIDYVRMSAQGGALEFSRAPFLVLNIQSPDGGPLDGILGNNFFWNRNMILEPSLIGNGFLHLSDPVLADADYDSDRDIDLEDAAFFLNAFGGPDAMELDPFYAHVDSDGNGTIDLRDFGVFQRCFSGGDAADPTCGM